MTRLEEASVRIERGWPSHDSMGFDGCTIANVCRGREVSMLGFGHARLSNVGVTE